MCHTHLRTVFGDCMFVLCRCVLSEVVTRAALTTLNWELQKDLKKKKSIKRERARTRRQDCFPDFCYMSVQVAQAGSLASFLHEGTELELLPGQKTHVLKWQRQRVAVRQAGREQTGLYMFTKALLGHHITC